MGSKIVEKHFTDDTNRKGPDHPFSMDPHSWKKMVESNRLLEAALGNTIKKVEDNELETVILQRRAVRAVKNLKIGELVSRNNIEFQRPCPSDALKPNEFQKFKNKKLLKSIKSGDIIKISDIEQ